MTPDTPGPGTEDAEAVIQEVRAHLGSVKGSTEMDALAEQCGVSRSTLYNIRRGHSRPEIHVAAAILAAFKRRLTTAEVTPTPEAASD